MEKRVLWMFRLKNSHPLTGLALTHPVCLGLVGAVSSVNTVRKWSGFEGIMLSETNLKGRQILHDLVYWNLKRLNPLIQPTDCGLPELGCGEWVKWMNVVKWYKLPVLRKISPRNVMSA